MMYRRYKPQDQSVLDKVREAVEKDVSNIDSIYDSTLIYPDGHSLKYPRTYTDLGIPDDVVATLTHTVVSDGSPKGQLYDNKGVAVAQLSGCVKHLDWLEWLCNAFDVTDYESKMGRGFQAKEYANALWRKFKGGNHE